MYISGNRKHTVKVRDKTVDLKETKDLYGHLMVLTRLNRDIDQKQAIGTYEFTLKSQSVFSPDGVVLQAVTSPDLSTHSRRWSPPTRTMQTSKNSPMTAHTPRHQLQIIAKRLLLLMGWP